MHIGDFDFVLPAELVAQEPPQTRGESRLMVVRRDAGSIEHSNFRDLPDLLQSGDLLVVNNTRVFPARLLGRRLPGGGAVECLLVRQLPLPGDPPDAGSAQLWEALVHPGQRLRDGSRIEFEGDGVRLHGEVVARRFFGRREVRLWADPGTDVGAAIERIGHMPLPPYIKRPDTASDRDRYQTVFAREKGSIAAPTAGLHFTSELFERLAARRIERAEITLHVGYGTFKPIRAEHIEEHSIDSESYLVDPDAATALTRARREGRRIIAVGTTTTRVLESLTLGAGETIEPAQGETQLYIRPGHRFQMVSGMVTNFHLPKSSLLVLVSAFAGRELILRAYREAVASRYRFYSYGDAMLIL